MATRQNIANLSATELAAWRQVITRSMALSDNRGYVHFAGMHGLPNQFCQQDGAAAAHVGPDQRQVPDVMDFSVTPPRTVRAPGPPGELPSTATIQSILGAFTFDDFSTQIEDPHNQVHGWVGGTMSIVPIAAFDPIFFAHHTMIDRLWYLWQLRNPNAGVGTLAPDQALPGTPLNVSQVLDISRLGYDYATKVISA